MQAKMNKRVLLSILPIILIFILSCTINLDDFVARPEEFDSDTEYAGWQKTKERATDLATTVEPPQQAEPDSPPPVQVQAEATPVDPDEFFLLTFTFSAADMQDLPLYRATLGNPFKAYKDNTGLWLVTQTANRTDDLQATGGIQPGSVEQNSAFNGVYNPITGILTGKLTHYYYVHQLPTEDYLESQANSTLNCEMSLVQVEGTNTLQGTCTGSLIWVYEVPGHSDHNSSTNKQITYQVSTELPEEMQN